MKRLFVLVEGQTEEIFFKQIVAKHLLGFNVIAVPIIVTTSREPSGMKHQGGGRWAHWKNQLHLLRDQHRGSDIAISSLFDLYGLPSDFPKLDEHRAVTDTKQRVELL